MTEQDIDLILIGKMMSMPIRSQVMGELLYTNHVIKYKDDWILISTKSASLGMGYYSARINLNGGASYHQDSAPTLYEVIKKMLIYYFDIAPSAQPSTSN